MFNTAISKYELFIFLIIFVKIIFLITAIANKYLLRKSSSSKWLEATSSIKAKTEFLFIALMSMLLIYLFNPLAKVKPAITKETYYLLYIFGWLLLFTADWAAFMQTTRIYAAAITK